MNIIREMKFVGGQEDGKFHYVDDMVDHICFHEKLDDVPLIGDNHVAANTIRKAITYVRQGDVMVCEE